MVLACFVASRRTVVAGAAMAFLAGMSLLPTQAAAQYDVPYVPTPQPVVDKMLEMANVTKDDYLIDLGSGDGRIVVTAAQKYGATALGVDLNPERISEANANAQRARVTDQVKFLQQDLFKTDISKADVLTMYLLPSVNLKLRPVVLDTLRPGTRVVSHAFDMGEWTPDETATVEGKTIYRWIVPAKVAGTWTVTEEGGKSYDLTLEQTFQQVKGTMKGGGAVSGKLDGTKLTLSVGDRTLTGEVTGAKMQGTAGGTKFTAQRSGG